MKINCTAAELLAALREGGHKELRECKGCNDPYGSVGEDNYCMECAADNKRETKP